MSPLSSLREQLPPREPFVFPSNYTFTKKSKAPLFRGAFHMNITYTNRKVKAKHRLRLKKGVKSSCAVEWLVFESLDRGRDLTAAVNELRRG